MYVGKVKNPGENETVTKWIAEDGYKLKNDEFEIGSIEEDIHSDEYKAAIEPSKIKQERKKAQYSAGLTSEYWIEINIEEDQAKIDKFRSDWQAINDSLPIPN